MPVSAPDIPPGIDFAGRAEIAGIILKRIPAPFPEIAMHIKQTKRIGKAPADLVGTLVIVVSEIRP